MPRPASPARNSSETMFGSISVDSSRVKKPGLVSTISAFAVSSVKSRGTVTVPSTLFSSAGSVGAITSITFLASASEAVRFDAWRTAASAHTALRPCDFARPRSEAAASLISLRRRSLPMFAPLPWIGVDEPMFVSGAIASRSAACEIHTPADAARAPAGDTYTITGILSESSFCTILRIESSSPPGVSSTITTAL